MERFSILRAGFVSLVALMVLQAADAGDAAPRAATPWGIAGSASSRRDVDAWFPKMAEAGVATVRLFPEWNGIQPNRETWKWEGVDALLKAGEANKIEIQAVMMGSIPWTKDKPHTFPVAALDDWGAWVSACVAKYKDRIRYWECWNEGNAGFNSGKHTTADYAKLALAFWDGAKKADPNAQAGLTVASYDPAYLYQTLKIMGKDGKAGNFDFLCIHPYEVADGMHDPDGEIPFLWMTAQLREMLKQAAPEKANADIWITEMGSRVGYRGTTEKQAAQSLVKLYTMAIAQGIRRSLWFEGRDPQGEEPGFGLLKRDGSPRPSYHALKNLAKHLGSAPEYIGWLALGSEKRGYGFVFKGPATHVLITWMPHGTRAEKIAFSADIKALDPLAADESVLSNNTAAPLDTNPVLILHLPADMVDLARANAPGKFPWGGNFAHKDTISLTPGSAGGQQGVLQAGGDTPLCTFPDGSTGVIVKSDQFVRFYAHPTYSLFECRDYYVRVTVRRLAPGNQGMNLFYEVADSQGRGPYANSGTWFSLNKSEGWQTHTWQIKNACFARMWGHDIAFRAEQSAPFVIGKVEISKVPFE